MKDRKVCTVTQLFGDNKNRLFYGPRGHQGIDFRTKGRLKWLFHKLTKTRRLDRTSPEKAGLIPIQATHDGFLVIGYNDDKKNGVYMMIESVDKKYRTFYFHLDKLRVWKGDEKTTGHEVINGQNFVKAGTIIGWGGNTGRYTTGAHLHFEVRERQGNNYVRVDPMPYFDDSSVVVHATYIHDSNIVNNSMVGIGPYKGTWFYQGQQIPRSGANSIIASL